MLAGRALAPGVLRTGLGLGFPAAACVTGTQFGTTGREAFALKAATVPLNGTMMSRQTPEVETARQTPRRSTGAGLGQANTRPVAECALDSTLVAKVYARRK